MFREQSLAYILLISLNDNNSDARQINHTIYQRPIREYRGTDEN